MYSVRGCSRQVWHLITAQQNRRGRQHAQLSAHHAALDCSFSQCRDMCSSALFIQSHVAVAPQAVSDAAREPRDWRLMINKALARALRSCTCWCVSANRGVGLQRGFLFRHDLTFSLTGHVGQGSKSRLARGRLQVANFSLSKGVS
jgi:hypothetical protein